MAESMDSLHMHGYCMMVNAEAGIVMYRRVNVKEFV